MKKNHAENVHQKLIPDPFLILVNNPKQSLNARNSFTNQIFWMRSIKKFLKRFLLYFSFELHVIRMSLACHPYVTCMYSYVIRMSLVCTCRSSICHSYVPVYHPYVTRMSSVCHSYVLVCHPYVTRMWFYYEP